MKKFKLKSARGYNACFDFNFAGSGHEWDWDTLGTIQEYLSKHNIQYQYSFNEYMIRAGSGKTPFLLEEDIDNLAKEFNSGEINISIDYGRCTGIYATIINGRVVKYLEDFDPVFEPEDDF